VEDASWREDSVRHRAPDGERIEELQLRAMRCATEILTAHPGQTVAVVAHGGSVKAILCGVMGFSLSLWRRLRLDNTSISRILFAPLGPTLVTYNDVCHLE
jgi:broad specificity phosphatase PhoE